MEMNRFLVVYDPTRDEQPALERAAMIAWKVGASLHLYACIYNDAVGADPESEQVDLLIKQQEKRLEKRLAAIAGEGVATSMEVEWHKDWPNAAVKAAERHSADMLFKSSFKHSVSERLLKSSSDWTVIRECFCPVMLVKNTDRPEVPRILAGIDISVRAHSYEELNDHILEFSRRLVASELAEVHVVNAFPDYRVKPKRKELMEVSGLDREHVHVKLGPPERVLVEMAKRLEATLVIVGNSHRSGLAAMMHPNTAEKILDKLDCNVLAMP